jgi:hypothetical protein
MASSSPWELQGRYCSAHAGAFRRIGERTGMPKLRYGDRVLIENLGIEGEVSDVDTRSIVVRYKKADGELVEHRFRPDDLRYIPKPHQSPDS